MLWVRRIAGEGWCTVRLPKIVGKDRPRFNGRQHRTYTTRKTANAEKRIASAWREQVGDSRSGFDGIVAIEVTAEQPLAKSNPKYWAGRAFSCSPDGDNILKLVLDALNGLAFADDAQIVEMHMHKLPRTPYGGVAEIQIHVIYYTETYMEA